MLGDDVISWLATQPDWQRDLARRVATRVELTDEDYVEALRMITSQFGVPIDGAAPTVRPIHHDDLSPPAPDGTTRLLAFGSLQGVGVISEHEELRFCPTGLTLIYGQNAVGKSSYVRALKVLCHTVDRDCQVRGSIYDGSPGATPSAKIEIDIDGEITRSGRRSANRQQSG